MVSPTLLCQLVPMALLTPDRYKRAISLLRDRPELLRAWGHALVWSPLVASSLRFRGFAATLDWIERLAPARAQPLGLSLDETERPVRWAFRIQPWLDGKCLQRSLVQLALARRSSTPARLVIGVRRVADVGVDAHAWLEVANDELDTGVQFVARDWTAGDWTAGEWSTGDEAA